MDIENRRNRKTGSNIIDNIILVMLLLLIGSASIFSSKIFILFLACFLIFYVSLHRFVKFNKLLFYSAVIWGVLNFLVSIVFDVPYFFLRIINNYLLLLLIPILSIQIIGTDFWFKLERIIYFLTKLSIPIFLLNVIFPAWFINLSNIFKPLTRTLLSEFSFNRYYWSALVYVHMDTTTLSGMFRNAGFMWEPGAFAWIIILSISIIWLRDGVEFGRKFFVYLTALISTFSTAGYVAITILIAGALYGKKKFKYFFIAMIFLVISLPFLMRLDFVGKEIIGYAESINNESIIGRSEEFDVAKVNRFQIIKYHIIDVLKYPLGYGVYSNSDINQLEKVVGVNGITHTLFVWGIPLFLLILLLIWRFFMWSNLSKSNLLLLTTVYMANIVMLFSNPVTFNILLYLIVLAPLIFKKQRYA